MSQRKRSATVHTYREWTCPCGKVCLGNGGKASHQRACRTYKEYSLATMKRSIEKWEDEGRPSGYRRSIVEKWQKEIKALEKELAE